MSDDAGGAERGSELGVIPPAVFAMLVIMAVVTTVMTTPLLRRFLRDV